jgi:hypothetical protein
MFLKHFTPDRRRRKRQLINNSIRVFTNNGSIEGLGINISDVGMCLFTVANISLGSRVQVELPQRSSETMRVSGIVRHRALYLYGIEFSEESDREVASQPSAPFQSEWRQ